MNDAADVIVIGGGIIGLTTAWRLARNGLGVTVLEAAPRPGLGASRAGAGILMPLYPWRHGEEMQARLRHSLEMYPELIADLKAHTGSDAGYRRTGMLALEHEEREQAALWAQANKQPLEQLDRGQCLQLQPQIHAPNGGLWLPEVNTVDNPALLRLMARRLRQLGVMIVSNCKVRQVRHNGSEITALDTSKGTYHAASYILAAGAHSGAIGGVKPPVRPVRGQMLALAAKPNPLRHVVLSGGYYIAPRRHVILVGSTVEEAGFDNSTSAQARTELMTAASKIMPQLKDSRCRAQWAGLRPGSASILTGRGEYRNLYLNTGHHRNGLALAPGSASLLGELLPQPTSGHSPAPTLSQATIKQWSKQHNGTKPRVHPLPRTGSWHGQLKLTQHGTTQSAQPQGRTEIGLERLSLSGNSAPLRSGS